MATMKKKLIELTIERDPVEEDLKPRPRYYVNGAWHYYRRNEEVLCDVSDFEIRIVNITAGRHLHTVVETAYTDRSSVVSRWLRYVDTEHRKRRAPLLASVVFYTSSSEICQVHRYCRRGGSGYAAARFKKPIECVCLCVGGTHCIVYTPGNPNMDWEWDVVNNPFKYFLEDRRVKVVGEGMEEFAAKVKEEWGVEVANPVDLRKLAVEAVGEKRLRGLRGLKEITDAVLEGIKLGERPKEMKDVEWGIFEMTEEFLKYATCDAYLAFEIGKKCLEKTGRL